MVSLCFFLLVFFWVVDDIVVCVTGLDLFVCSELFLALCGWWGCVDVWLVVVCWVGGLRLGGGRGVSFVFVRRLCAIVVFVWCAWRLR